MNWILIKSLLALNGIISFILIGLIDKFALEGNKKAVLLTFLYAVCNFVLFFVYN